MDEIWCRLDEFPSYSISSLGRVLNEDTKKELKQSCTSQGASKVGLVRGGRQHTRSVKVLVAEAFVEGRSEVFDTPIHLDGDPLNNAVDNLAWRPRWFAWRYSRQFVEETIYHGRGPIIDVHDKMIYPTVFDVAVVNGLLVEDVWKSIVKKGETFPTWQQFELVG